MADFCQLQLSCANRDEADKITAALLEKDLIACGKTVPINSTYVWRGNKENSDEVLVIMESREDLFEEAEKIVDKMHSYETPVLTAIKLTKLSERAENWLRESLRHE